MNLDSYRKNIKELEDELIKCRQDLEKNLEKAKVLKFSKFESRLESFFIFSMIPFFVFIVSSFWLGPTIINYVSIEALYGIVFGLPAVIGISLEKHFFNNVWKIKERLNSFSIAKKRVDILREETIYQMESEYLKNKINVIEEILERLKKDEFMMKTLLQKYDINVKNNDNLSFNLKKETDNLDKKLETLLKELRVLSKKSVLKNKFWRTYDKFQSITEPTMFTMMSGLFFMIFSSFLQNHVNLTVSFLDVLLPFPIVGVFVLGYYYKKNKIAKTIFREFNQDLNEEAFDESKELEDARIIRQKINDKIESICNVLIELQENKSLLSEHEIDDNQNDAVNKYSLFNDKEEVIYVDVEKHKKLVKKL